MNRRQAMAGLLGAAVASRPFPAWPQSDRVRRIAVIASLAADDPELVARLTALRSQLDQLGWTEGRDLRIDIRGSVESEALMRAAMADLVERPEAIVTTSSFVTEAVKKADPNMPVVFMGVSDPIGRGWVASLARPGGLLTGFAAPDGALAGKWLELLNEIAPGLRRVAVLVSPLTNEATYKAALADAPRRSPIDLSFATFGAPDDIDALTNHLGASPGAGLIVLPGFLAGRNRVRIIAAAARNRLPAVYPFREYAKSGGLMSYGINFVELHRQGAVYVDRILRGSHPSDLPVQTPATFELVVNVAVARALGLDPPLALLARADQVIE